MTNKLPQSYRKLFMTYKIKNRLHKLIPFELTHRTNLVTLTLERPIHYALRSASSLLAHP